MEPINIVGINKANAYFDEVIGHIEDIVLSEAFEQLHANFMEGHWQLIERGDENKLEYMDIFQKYTTIFESFFMEELTKRMPNFDMKRFAEELDTKYELDDTINNGEIIEFLHSFSNFEIFKELMLDYRSKKEGNFEQLYADLLVAHPLTAEQLNKEEQGFTDMDIEELEENFSNELDA